MEQVTKLLPTLSAGPYPGLGVALRPGLLFFWDMVLSDCGGKTESLPSVRLTARGGPMAFPIRLGFYVLQQGPSLSHPPRALASGLLVSSLRRLERSG